LLIKTGVTAALPCRTEPTSYSPTGCTTTTAYGPVATSPAASAPTGPPQPCCSWPTTTRRPGR
jgi:hypothetical protein